MFHVELKLIKESEQRSHANGLVDLLTARVNELERALAAPPPPPPTSRPPVQLAPARTQTDAPTVCSAAVQATAADCAAATVRAASARATCVWRGRPYVRASSAAVDSATTAAEACRRLSWSSLVFADVSQTVGGVC